MYNVNEIGRVVGQLFYHLEPFPISCLNFFYRTFYIVYYVIILKCLVYNNTNGCYNKYHIIHFSIFFFFFDTFYLSAE